MHQQSSRLLQRSPVIEMSNQPPSSPPNRLCVKDMVKLYNAHSSPYSSFSYKQNYYQNFNNRSLRGKTEQSNGRTDTVKTVKRRSWLHQNDIEFHRYSPSSESADALQIEHVEKPVQNVIEETKEMNQPSIVADKIQKSLLTKPKQSTTPELKEALKKELRSDLIENSSSESATLKLEQGLQEVELKKISNIEEQKIEINVDLEEASKTIHKGPKISCAKREKPVAELSVIEDNISNSNFIPDDISSSSDVSVVFEENQGLKGILKLSGQTKHNKRIKFDPFILFLDGALEGQLDTVQENATKILNVSKSNDEGVTALHNAICGSHYDIVKFLVDAKADVNALDSDGWSPLHCAASCNNLAMLKLLVEHGACIYATTLSDAEMPIKKCDKKETGFEQCVNYLEMCDKWAGIINNGYIYAVYDYDAMSDNELSFKEGDALKVISKEESDDGLWWLCELNHKKGFVPTNFIGLYPTLKVAGTMKFKYFDEIPNRPPPQTINPAKSKRINNEFDLSEKMKIKECSYNLSTINS